MYYDALQQLLYIDSRGLQVWCCSCGLGTLTPRAAHTASTTTQGCQITSKRLSKAGALGVTKGCYLHWTICAEPKSKVFHLQNWLGIHPLLQEHQQLGCSMVLRAHHHTPVDDLIWCIPTVKDSRSNEFHWKFTVAATRNGFGNSTVDV